MKTKSINLGLIALAIHLLIGTSAIAQSVSAKKEAPLVLLNASASQDIPWANSPWSTKTVADFSKPIVANQGSSCDCKAASNCTNWHQNDDGTCWRKCEKDDGTGYCEKCDNGNITSISCP